MIMRIKGFDLEIEFNGCSNCVLTILNKPVFRKVLSDLYALKKGSEINDIVIESEGKILDYEDDLEILIDYNDINFKARSIVNALHKDVISMIQNDVELNVGVELKYKELINLVYDELMSYDLDITYDSEFDLNDFIKLVNFRLDTDSCHNTLEQFYLYLDVLSYFHLTKVLIFVNLKSYFNDVEIKDLYKYMLYKKMTWICIEAYESVVLDNEHHYLIDEDLIESTI